MQIKIDTSEVLKNEDLRNEIISQISDDFRNDLADVINREVVKVIREDLKKQINEVVRSKVESVIVGGLDDEYIPTDCFGSKSEPTTLRNYILHIFKKETVFSKSNYRSDNNAFTNILNDIISKQVVKACGEYHKLIDSEFLKEVHNYSVNHLRERMKLK